MSRKLDFEKDRSTRKPRDILIDMSHLPRLVRPQTSRKKTQPEARRELQCYIQKLEEQMKHLESLDFKMIYITSKKKLVSDLENSIHNLRSSTYACARVSENNPLLLRAKQKIAQLKALLPESPQKPLSMSPLKNTVSDKHIKFPRTKNKLRVRGSRSAGKKTIRKFCP